MATTKTEISTISPGLAPEYSDSSAYYVGDVVLWQNRYWRCTSEIPSPGETWTEEHWEPRDDITDIVTDIIYDNVDDADYEQFPDTMASDSSESGSDSSSSDDPGIYGKEFDLSTEAGVTKALAAVLETLGGVITAGGSTDMIKQAPITIKNGVYDYHVSVYDDSEGVGLDVERVSDGSSDSSSL